MRRVYTLHIQLEQGGEVVLSTVGAIKLILYRGRRRISTLYSGRRRGGALDSGKMRFSTLHGRR